MADVLAGLERRLGALAAERPELAPRLARLLDACRRAGAALGDAPEPAPIHGDLHGGHVLVDAGRLWLLDLEAHALGDPALDAGTLAAHLTEQALREHGDPEALAAVRRAFTEAFLLLSGGQRRRAVGVHADLALAGLVQRSGTVAGRGHLTEPLLELCEERFGLAPRQGPMSPRRLQRPSRREVAVVTAEAFPADGALPQLPAACDPDHVGRLLAGHLRPQVAVGVERCDLQAVRHRPGRRTVLEYRLTVVTPDGEAGPRWPVTGLLFAAPGRARAVARGLDREAAGRRAWPAPLAPVAFLDELDMVVLAYPFDRRLTALPVLAGVRRRRSPPRSPPGPERTPAPRTCGTRSSSGTGRSVPPRCA